jgi:DNA helicase-2/ATP-dependent DNA helicase PcrA
MHELLQQLNEPQRQAVTKTEGPIVVIAGAGSGKTRVITYRVAYLIGAKGVSPRNILAVTFTNKAAGEMRARIHRLLGATDLESWISTFHSMCSRILRREAERLGYTRSFAIYDESDQTMVVKQCMRNLNLPERDFRPSAILSRISLAKNNLQSPESFEGTAIDYFAEAVARVYRKYQKLLLENNAMDFDDLLNNTLKVFLEHPDCIDKYRSFFRYVLVDEFQDTNRVQYELVREIAREHRNLCVVGDDDQSIYSWRGANIENLFDLQKDFPEATTVFLEENYRSTQVILDAANAVIRHNDRRKPKKLWTQNERGEKVEWYVAFNERDEARYIVERIVGLKSKDAELSLNDFAVFYRTNAQSRVLEDEFRSSRIPYTVVGSVRFYERKEVKDVLAYLKLAANPSDSVGLKRIINMPPRGIGAATIEKAEKFAADSGILLFDAIGRPSEIPGLRKATCKSLKDFHGYISRLIEEKNDVAAADLLQNVMNDSGYAQMLRQDQTFEAQARLENLDELVSAAAEIGESLGDASLDAFLENVSLQSTIDDWDEMRETVTLMTLHLAKGLEFPVVFMAGMEEGLLPHANTLADKGLEEERRLCYVGLTRARKRVILTSADMRRLRGNVLVHAVSRFIDEIPASLMNSRSTSQGMADHRDEYCQHMPDYENAAFSEGDVVEHTAFGVGKISGVSGSGERMKVAVRFFRDNKQRDLLVKYAGLRKRERGVP